MKKKAKKKLQISLIAVAVIAVISVFSLLYVAPDFAEIRRETIYMEVDIMPRTNGTPKFGMNVDPGDLDFGVFPVDFEATRSIIIHNEYNSSVVVKLQVTGNISQLHEINDSKIVLGVSQEKDVPILIKGNLGPPGNYTGELEIIYYKDVPWLII